ncbi:TIGR01440 family protein [Paracerasibacillus soli]|uniref:UPF0340 protein RWD45_14040 n=1 Tax=Paracerasibacillus soli TaxID=480284 RepID=A0ABU5CUI2_9BACI|nr:TIGR01440 family protein [Virgibacillus soli]MDY0409497.1 TIGR01440 family protein [Virgibacillus soli]
MKQVKQDMEKLMDEWLASSFLKEGDIFVVGCSTSEVAGKEIGTDGSIEIAERIFAELKTLAEKARIHLAFQCCEHLNRALVVEKTTMDTYHLEQVSVIPVRNAGGSMATEAFKQMDAPVVVEEIQGHAGIDIGETFIGMHLKHVVVPVRMKQRTIGQANVMCARTRPKLIGGARAVYEQKQENDACQE